MDQTKGRLQPFVLVLRSCPRGRRRPRFAHGARRRRRRRDGLQGYHDRVRLVIGRSPRHGIDAHPDKTAGQNVPGETGRACGRNILGELNDLRLEAFFLEGDGNIGVALGEDRARRHASRRYIKPGYDGLGTGRGGRNADVFQSCRG
jgi:hypothetical protein